MWLVVSRGTAQVCIPTQPHHETRKKRGIMVTEPDNPVPSSETIPALLSADESLYCALLEAAPDAIVVVAHDGSIVLVNAQTEQLFGYTRADLVGRPVELLIPRSAHMNHRGHRAGYFAKPSVRPMGSGLDLQAVRKDGTVFPVEISLSPVETRAGRLVSAAIRDSTVRKAMDDTIRASNRRLEAVLAASTQVAIMATDLQGRITVFNSGAERMLGYRAIEIVGRATPLIFHLESEVVDHAQRLSETFGRRVQDFEVFVEYARQGSFEEREWTYVCNDGTHLTVLLVVTALHDEAGQMTGFLGVARDITERKQATDALCRAHDELEARVRERTADLHAAQAMAHLGSWEWEIRSGAERWSDEQFRIFGYEPNAVTPSYDAFVDALHPDDRARVLAAVNATLNLDHPYDLECRIIRPNGDTRVVQCRGDVTRDPDGRPIRMVGTFLDITDRTRLEQTRATLAAIVASSDDAIIGESLDGLILSWNPAAEHISGYSASEVVGRPLSAMVSPESADMERTILDRVSRGQSVAPYEAVRIRKDGATVHVSITVFPITDSTGRIIGLSRFVKDITARKQAEEHLRKAERLAELGTLASGMAHEIGTPMNVILGRAEFLMERVHDEPTKKGLQTIVSQVERITKLMHQLLTYTRRRPPERRPFELQQTIGESSEFFRERFAKHRIVVKLACEEHCPAVLADPDQMSQVLINLLVNALHAMPEGGTIYLGLNSSEGKAVLTVADTGHGIAKEHLPKIFDAFFTTKDKGNGTGLGLSVVKGMIEEHGGTITVDSELRRGTTFTIHLPLS